ncbi:MAG: epoxyqueuosine reductase [Candidatus Thorarchaeota archaeon]|nr:epoxyqueuosine reductase [Candidatus Thorarchaeota archaeon]
MSSFKRHHKKSPPRMITTSGVIPESEYKSRVLSVRHLQELRDDFRSIDDEGHISDNETFRSYISGVSYSPPESMPEAKSIIVIAVFTPMALVNFHYNGSAHELVIPPQYYETGLKEVQIIETIQKNIILESGHRVVKANPSVLLKRLAVRSGLARYGRNNITYVDEFGSFITLYAYFTDFQFERDDWTEVKMLEECSNCRTCRNKCQTGAIRGDPFVIDVGKCVTLYNEISGEFPDWIPKSAHNALMGCMACQMYCPANKSSVSRPIKFEDITQDETTAILEGVLNEDELKSLSSKLRGYSPTDSIESFPIFTRNLKVLLNP